MKTFYLKNITTISLFLFTISFINAQTLDINLNQLEDELVLELKEGNYTLKIDGTLDCGKHKVFVYLTNKPIILTPISSFTEVINDKNIKQCLYSKTISLPLEKNSEITVTVTIADTDGSIIKTFKRTLKTIKYKAWITSLGLASSVLLQSDTYRTVENTDGTFTIREGGSQNIFRPNPLMQFSYIDLRKDWGFAPSGGIGFDLENISVFGGVSLYFGQNFVITTGLAFHMQLRLKNDYLPNEVVSSTIAFDDLNVDYYRINPFISLTFRLDKNPFKK